MRFKVVAIFLLLLLSCSIWAGPTEFNLWLHKGEDLHTSTDVAFSKDPYPSTESDPVEYEGELDLSTGSASIYATAKTASYEPVTLYVIFSGLATTGNKKEYLPLTVTYDPDPETTGGETTKTAENSTKVHIQLDETFTDGASASSNPIRALSYKLDLSTEDLDSRTHGSHYETTMTLALEAN